MLIKQSQFSELLNFLDDKNYNHWISELIRKPLGALEIVNGIILFDQELKQITLSRYHQSYDIIRSYLQEKHHLGTSLSKSFHETRKFNDSIFTCTTEFQVTVLTWVESPHSWQHLQIISSPQYFYIFLFTLFYEEFVGMQVRYFGEQENFEFTAQDAHFFILAREDTYNWSYKYITEKTYALIVVFHQNMKCYINSVFWLLPVGID